MSVLGPIEKLIADYALMCEYDHSIVGSELDALLAPACAELQRLRDADLFLRLIRAHMYFDREDGYDRHGRGGPLNQDVLAVMEHIYAGGGPEALTDSQRAAVLEALS